MDTIKQTRIGSFTARLHHDPYATDPREWSNVSTIVLPEGGGSPVGIEDHEYEEEGEWHVEHVLPGEDHYEEALRSSLGAVVLVPLLYEDHGSYGSRVSVADDWEDANGYAYTTEERPLGVKTEDVRDAIEHEVGVLSQWLQGDTYGWSVVNATGEVVESCWGYIGDEWAWKEARHMADVYASREKFAEETVEVPVGPDHPITMSIDGVVYDAVEGQTLTLRKRY